MWKDCCAFKARGRRQARALFAIANSAEGEAAWDAWAAWDQQAAREAAWAACREAAWEAKENQQSAQWEEKREQRLERRRTLRLIRKAQSKARETIKIAKTKVPS